MIETYTYEIDELDRIVAVDDAWLRFAQENDAPGLTREVVLGKDISRYIGGIELANLYAMLFRALRNSQSRIPVRLPFRCDSPDLVRQMELFIEPLPNRHIVLASVLLEKTRRPRIPLLDQRSAHNGKWQLICSGCKRLNTFDRGWSTIEEAIPDPYEEPAAGLPLLSQTLCPQCKSDILLAAASCSC